MKYQPLLYSRSFSGDYRWLIVPSDLDETYLQDLNLVYSEFHEHVRLLNDLSLPVFYLINKPKGSFAFRCLRTAHEDVVGRTIYALEGIFVKSTYQRSLWFSIPWILAQQEQYLDIWKTIEFSEADSLRKQGSQPLSLDLGSLCSSPLLPWATTDLNMSALYQNGELRLSYSQTGLTQLLNILRSPYFPLMDIAFGTTSEVLGLLQIPRIVALYTGSQQASRTIGDDSNEQPKTRLITDESGFSLGAEDWRAPTRSPANRFEKSDPSQKHQGTLHQGQSRIIPALKRVTRCLVSGTYRKRER